MYSLWSIWQYIIIGSDNGLAPNKRQAIIWTNYGLVSWRKYASRGLNEFTAINGNITLRDDSLTVKNKDSCKTTIMVFFHTGMYLAP